MLYYTFIGIIAGIAASMGLGGGTFLIIFLTAMTDIDQKTAQGINLMFFIPIAAVSAFFHYKNGYLEMKKIIPAVITGMITSCIFASISVRLDNSMLRKLFGLFILFMGMKMMYRSVEKRKISHRF